MQNYCADRLFHCRTCKNKTLFYWVLDEYHRLIEEMGVRKVKWKRNDCTSHRTIIRQKKSIHVGFDATPWKSKKCCSLFPILWDIAYRLCTYAKLVLWYSWSVVLDISRICTTSITGTSMSSKPQQHGLCVCIVLSNQNALLSCEMQNKLKKLRSSLKMSIPWKSCYVVFLQHKYLLYADRRGNEKKNVNTLSGHVYHIKSTTIIIAWFESNALDSLQS